MADFQAGNWRKGLEAGSEMLAIQIGIQLVVMGVGALTDGVGSAPVEAALESAATGTRLATESAATAARGISQAGAEAADAGGAGVAKASSAAETGAVKSVSGVGNKTARFADDSMAGSGGGGGSSAVVKRDVSDMVGTKSSSISRTQILKDLNYNVKVDHPFLKAFKKSIDGEKGTLSANESTYRSFFENYLKEKPEFAKKYGLKNAKDGLLLLKRLEAEDPETAEAIFRKFIASKSGVTSAGFLSDMINLKTLMDNPTVLSPADKGFLDGFLNSDTFLGKQFKYFCQGVDKNPGYWQSGIDDAKIKLGIGVKSEPDISTVMALIGIK